jgi:shikimate dehydrogenase
MEKAVVKTYCIIGNPISHSLSPGMQNAAFAALGLNCTYISFRVPAEDLKEAIDSLRAINIAGFNVTIPHKVAVMNYLDELDTTAKKAGAVNTVKNIEGIFKGYNTDIAGFIEPLRRHKYNFTSTRTVLVLGAGGAARAVIAALAEENSKGRIIIANRGRDKAEQLARIGTNLGLRCETIPLQNATSLSSEAELIVNATSIGLNNEPSPIASRHISQGSIVYDLVYRPVVTDLLEQAKFAEARVIYGYEMLLEQGARAFEIWTGLSAPRDEMKKNLLGIFGEPT